MNEIKEMMVAWNKIEAVTKKAFPNATAEEQYKITAKAMRYAMGLKD